MLGLGVGHSNNLHPLGTQHKTTPHPLHFRGCPTQYRGWVLGVLVTQVVNPQAHTHAIKYKPTRKGGVCYGVLAQAPHPLLWGGGVPKGYAQGGHPPLCVASWPLPYNGLC